MHSYQVPPPPQRTQKATQSLLWNDSIFSPKIVQKHSKVSKIVLINRIILKLETAHHMRTSEASVGGGFSSALIQLGGSD